MKSALIGICSAALIGAAIWLGWTVTHPADHPTDALPTTAMATPSSPIATPGASGTRKPRGAVINGVPMQPTSRSTDNYVNQPYTAPRSAVSTPGAGGRLQVPSLGINAPVDVVQLNNGVMTIPNLTSQVGWLQGTAAIGDLTGASVIAGHVADDSDIPGALFALKDLHVGARIIWISPNGQRQTFVMTSSASYPRASGLPASVFRTDGPHVLNLITCFDKETFGNGGFHYLRNLVVTAKAA